MNEKPNITSDIRNNYKLSHNYCSGDPWPHDNQAGAGEQAVSAEFQAPLGATVISITDNRRHCYNGHSERHSFQLLDLHTKDPPNLKSFFKTKLKVF